MFTQSEVAHIVKDRVKRSKDKLRSELFEEAMQLLTPSACFGQNKKTYRMECLVHINGNQSLVSLATL